MTLPLRILVPLADGFEELEAVTLVDVLRRAGLHVVLADLGTPSDERAATGAHDIRIATDDCLDDLVGRIDASGAVQVLGMSTFAGIVLPGGMPGAATLRDDARITGVLRTFANAGRVVGAICAAPIALAEAGLLEGRRATAYPTFRDQLGGALVVEDEACVVDGHVFTAAGPGTALDFALCLVAELVGPAKAEELASAMLHAGRWQSVSAEG